MAFYWNKGAKVELSKSTTYRSVRFSGNVASQGQQQANVNAAVSNTPHSGALELGKGLLLYQTVALNQTQAQALTAEGRELTVFAAPSGEPMILTEEFNVQFKEEVTRQQIDALNAQNKVRIVRESKARKNAFVLALQADAGVDALAMANRYYESGQTLYSEPNFVRLVNPASVPNDPLFAQQWALKNTGQRGGIVGQDIRAVDAWNVSRGSPSITVAVIDVGIDYTHPDLVGQLVPGYDAVNQTFGPTIPQGNHGTACAGIIAASANNNIGISGVAPSCRIMGIRIGGIMAGMTHIAFQDSDVEDGIDQAFLLGADVLCLSWTYPPGTFMPGGVNAAITNALLAGRPTPGGLLRGCVVCCAAGNDNMGAIPEPASIPNVITVTACNQWGEFKSPGSQDGEVDWGSNFGAGVNLCAPGVQIRTTYNNNRYMDFSGTSASAAHVAGVAALVLSVRPNFTRVEVQHILEQSADNIGALIEVGNGRVNAHKALYRARTLVSNRISRGGPPLDPGEQLDSSPDGQFALLMWPDGNLEITGPEGRIWASSTQGNPNAHLTLRGDGTLAIVAADGTTVLWASGSNPTAASYGLLTNTGHLVLYTPANVPVWSTQGMLSVGVRLREGQPLTSFDGTMTLRMNNGNLELWQGVVRVWQSGTGPSPNAYAMLQEDGNFVIFNADGTQRLWASGTTGQTVVFVQLENGYFSLRTRTNEVWTSRSSLSVGMRLTQATPLVSSNGQHMLSMQLIGELMLLEGAARIRWASSTSTPFNFNAFARLDTNGHFVVYTADGLRRLWSSGVDIPNVGYLHVLDDGTFGLYAAGGVLAWSSGSMLSRNVELREGEELRSVDGSMRLVMNNGNLELFQGATQVWSSRVPASPGSYARLEPTGNLVILTAVGVQSWNTGTAGSDAVFLRLENGYIALYTQDGSVVWTSRTTHTLRVGEELRAGQRLVSQDGRYILIMQDGGNLEFRSAPLNGGNLLWDSSTGSNPGAYATLLPGGNFVVRSSDSMTTLWATRPADCGAVSIQVNNGGFFALCMPDDTAVWSSRSIFRAGGEMTPGTQQLLSPDGRAALFMQSTGDVEIIRNAELLWRSCTSPNPGARATLQMDGNFAIYTPALPHRLLLWATHQTGGRDGTMRELILHNEGYFTLYTQNGTAVWSSQSLLSRGVRLIEGRPLVSLDGTMLAMRNGNLELSRGGPLLWSSGTTNNPGAYAVLQDTGNFVVLAADGRVLWESRTLNRDAVFVQVEDGNFTLRALDGRALWSTQSTLGLDGRLSLGQRLLSPNGQVSLAMAGNGNLELRDNSNNLLWTSSTLVGSFATLSNQGSFAVCNTTGQVIWEAQMTSGRGHSLMLHNEGYFAVYAQDGTVLWSSRTMLSIGVPLSAQGVLSLNGTMRLCMQPTGNMELLRVPGNTRMWSSSTQNNPSARAELLPDGNFVIREAGRIIWQSGTERSGAVFVQVQNDEQFVLYTLAHREVWSSRSMFSVGGRLNSNDRLVSADGRFSLHMQPAGNLVFSGPSGTIWNSGTGNNNNAYAEFLMDGNLVIRSSDGIRTLWSSVTPGAAFAQIDDGHFVLYARDNSPVWSTRSILTASTSLTPVRLIGGQSLLSPNGQTRLEMQLGGNLVLHMPGRTCSISGTTGTGNYLMLLNGDLAVYSSTGLCRWNSRTLNSGATYLIVLNNGTFALRTTTGTQVRLFP